MWLSSVLLLVLMWLKLVVGDLQKLLVLRQRHELLLQELLLMADGQLNELLLLLLLLDWKRPCWDHHRHVDGLVHDLMALAVKHVVLLVLRQHHDWLVYHLLLLDWWREQVLWCWRSGLHLLLNLACLVIIGDLHFVHHLRNNDFLA